MQQMVSVLTDGVVRYFVEDGGEVTEVARIKVRADFEPTEAVTLGVNLQRAAGLNGYAPKPVAAKRGRPPKQKELPAAKTPKRRRAHHRINETAVSQAITELGGEAVLRDVAEVLKATGAGERKAVSNRLSQMVKSGTAVIVGRRSGERGTAMNVYSLRPR